METPCIPYEGAISRDGYGKTPNGSYAHRAAYESAYWPLEPGQLVRHLCHNRACINVEHLAVGTQVDNMRDMTWRKRLGACCPAGHDIGVTGIYTYPNGYEICSECCSRIPGNDMLHMLIIDVYGRI